MLKKEALKDKLRGSVNEDDAAMGIDWHAPRQTLL